MKTPGQLIQASLHIRRFAIPRHALQGLQTPLERKEEMFFCLAHFSMTPKGSAGNSDMLPSHSIRRVGAGGPRMWSPLCEKANSLHQRIGMGKAFPIATLGLECPL